MGNLKKGTRSLPGPLVKKRNFNSLKRVTHRHKQLAIALFITLLATAIYFQANDKTYDAKERVRLEATVQSLQQSKAQAEKLHQDQSAQEKAKLDEINKKLQETEKQLQAKRSTPKVYAAALPKAPTKAVAVSGTCGQWIANAGIADVASARALINAESGCNPNVVNRSSGACGVAQELPCGKSGCSLGDGNCQVRWMDSYVKGRYGSWSNAWATWNSRYPHWY